MFSLPFEFLSQPFLSQPRHNLIVSIVFEIIFDVVYESLEVVAV